MIDGSISEVKDIRSDWTNRETYRDFIGKKEIGRKNIDAVINWANRMEKQYKGTARIVIDWFGSMDKEALNLISKYPNTSPECLPEDERAVVRQQVKKEWREKC